MSPSYDYWLLFHQTYHLFTRSDYHFHFFQCQCHHPMITDYRFTKPTIYSPGESITFTFTAFTSSIADVIIITSFWLSFHQTYHLFTRSDNHFHFLSMSPVTTNLYYKWPFSSFVIINKVTAVLIVLQFAETQILDFSPNFHRTSFPHKSLREVGNVVNLTENSCRSQILCQFPRLPVASPSPPLLSG